MLNHVRTMCWKVLELDLRTCVRTNIPAYSSADISVEERKRETRINHRLTIFLSLLTTTLMFTFFLQNRFVVTDDDLIQNDET